MAKKTKYYVVWQGHTPGIYSSWEACQAQVKGYPDAKYKAFSTRAEAETAFGEGYFSSPRKKPEQTKRMPGSDRTGVLRESISVDAACSGNPGVMEYRGVDTSSGIELFRQGPYPQGTNNIGEFLAIVHGLALLKQKGDEKTAIYSDSRTAMKWVRDKRANTKLTQDPRNKRLFDLIRRAENWLKSNTYNNRILKWDTENWGEIPADFGRK